MREGSWFEMVDRLFKTYFSLEYDKTEKLGKER